MIQLPNYAVAFLDAWMHAKGLSDSEEGGAQFICEMIEDKCNFPEDCTEEEKCSAASLIGFCSGKESLR